MLGVYVVLVIIIFILLCWYKLRKSNAYDIIQYWNEYITDIRDEQNKTDSRDFDSVPSLQDAFSCKLESANKLNAALFLNHDQILSEVYSLLASGYEGVKISEIDNVQNNAFGKQKGWVTLWVKLIDCWAGTSDNLPTLKKIVQDLGDDISLLHVSIFLPGTELEEHEGISKGVYRYHYGLSIPDGDTGMTIERRPFKWEERSGYIFDDTLKHTSFNRTNKMRIVILADLPRKMGFFLDKINWLVIKLAQKTKHVKSIQDRLKLEGKSFN